MASVCERARCAIRTNMKGVSEFRVQRNDICKNLLICMLCRRSALWCIKISQNPICPCLRCMPRHDAHVKQTDRQTFGATHVRRVFRKYKTELCQCTCDSFFHRSHSSVCLYAPLFHVCVWRSFSLRLSRTNRHPFVVKVFRFKCKTQSCFSSKK